MNSVYMKFLNDIFLFCILNKIHKYQYNAIPKYKYNAIWISKSYLVKI